MMANITIEKIISDGKGLARPQGSKVVMVPGVLQGELVRVTPVHEYQGYIAAQLDEIVEPSPFRIEPACPWYTQCGGCDLQHSTYEHQLEIKNNIVQEAMKRAGIDCSSTQLQAPLASPKQTGYRHRIRLQLASDGQIGFHKSKTHALVPVNGCTVAAPEINRAIAFLQEERLLKQAADHCREIELLVSPSDKALTLLLHARKKQDISFSLLTRLIETPLITQTGYKIQGKIVAKTRLAPLSQDFFPVKEDDSNAVELSKPSYTLSWAASCFSQVNDQQNTQLVELVCKLIGNPQNKSVLDLYCGAGNFSIPLALMGAAVTGIELNRKSIQWAKQNAQQAGVVAHFFAADVSASLQQLHKNNEHADIILLDPPRRGLGKAAQQVAQLTAEKIVYISCDPATLARDLAIICKTGYHLTHLAPVDMFPQTHHIETVAILQRCRTHD